MAFGTSTLLKVLFCVVALTSSLLSASPNPMGPTCLKYEPVVVTLSGTLVRKTSPGPPGYENIAHGDRPETYWILKLSQPFCVEQDEEEPSLNPAQKNIRAVQLVVDASVYKKQKALVGKSVVVSGTLFGSFTGHHHTAVLLNVQSIEAGEKKPRNRS